MDSDVVDALSKSYTLTILSTLDEPMTVEEISEETEVPKATLYRRMRELDEIGFVEVSGSEITLGSGNGSKKYTRTITGVEIDFTAKNEDSEIKFVQ